MKISILDQAPVYEGASNFQALQEALRLAQTGEEYGYTRYWIAEHHDLKGLACPAPEIMIGYIGGQTKRIRLGSGAVLLPHYKPYKIAEQFNLLATLFPGRIDLGIGRAPGGSAEASMALSDNFLEKVWKMPELVKELLNFIRGTFASDHLYAKVKPSPVPDQPPIPWILGTSPKSAVLAAENGTGYVFGQFMSDHDPAEIIQDYYHNHKSNALLPEPNAILAVSSICALDSDYAQSLAFRNAIGRLKQDKGEGGGLPGREEAEHYPLTADEKGLVEAYKNAIIAGNPSEVGSRLMETAEKNHVDELMIITRTPDYQERLVSYQLIGKEIIKK
ncbi:LLM class flavin-dependent oxidoreductase [Peribacillus kribbensis]|uniref:LLM class flavin-dependent oxidoreductase n=1 Tax=Peribacillus kribbensis TaxID=356658 RepID=UPI0003FF9805|nr:LLM class flavin-dependent oxidoreductase [Peribacillus kribbensis]